MRLILLGLLLMAGCPDWWIEPVPGVCCETPEECFRLGLTSSRPCPIGTCVANLCVESGCDGNEDCSLGTVCLADVCVAIDGPPSTPEGMAEIPAGPFVRGCYSAHETCTAPEELPQQIVMLSRYYIDLTEVTQYDYEKCVLASVCQMPYWETWDPIALPTYPVVGVSWEAARNYCEWRKKRLPTEAEWEKAARGLNGMPYPWGKESPTCALANFGTCFGGGAWPVGSAPAGDSPFRVHDMAGNVREWVHDWYDPDYYETSPTVDPQGPMTGEYKVVRGGAWGQSTLDGVKELRAANRIAAFPPAGIRKDLGFRCASN